MADSIFEHPRLARIYDPFDSNRVDLDPYVAMVNVFGARSVLDIGCGTGTFACLLVRQGVAVVGLDPARASLDVARAKAGADRVRWIHGVAADLPPLQVDLATMTGNVAQVFLDDSEWADILRAAHAALAGHGRLVFETRDPRRKAWRDWTPEKTRKKLDVPGIGVVETWCELLRVEGELVTFRWTYVFESDGAVIQSESTLRFRSRVALTRSLLGAGFAVDEIRDAPDRPGLEFVFVATK